MVINNNNEQVDGSKLLSHNLTKNTAEKMSRRGRRQRTKATLGVLEFLRICSVNRYEMERWIIGCFLRFIGCTLDLMAETSPHKLFPILTSYWRPRQTFPSNQRQRAFRTVRTYFIIINSSSSRLSNGAPRIAISSNIWFAKEHSFSRLHCFSR